MNLCVAESTLRASIELLPKQVLSSVNLPAILPPGTSVYLADVAGSAGNSETVAAAKLLQNMGFNAVPHIAARRATSKEQLRDHLGRLSQEAGVRDILLVAGGIDTPCGPFGSTMSVLTTGLLDQFGISELAIAGHPEGAPHFSGDAAIEVLKAKCTFSQRTGANLRIVTQFGFDPHLILAWVDGFRRVGVDTPIHIGVAGPAKITTLLKYGAMCGIGNSLVMLGKRAGVFTSLASGYSPETVVEPIERHLACNRSNSITQMHVFPFGGLQKSAEWLRQRCSW